MFETLLSNEVLALFAVISTGLLIGRVNIGGISLGSSGVIFTALAFGHLGVKIPAGVGALGLVLFVYCVGLRAGPGFFRNFVRQGKSLTRLGGMLILVGAATAWGMSRLLHIPADLTAGIFAGALTSTPGLAAAAERLPEGSQVAVGYGLAYPFGVIGVVLFVQLLPRLLRTDLNQLGRELQAKDDPGRKIIRVLVEVMNPAVIGKRLSDLEMIAESNCQVPRRLEGNQLLPVSPTFTLEAGQHVLVVGREFRVPTVVSLLGRRSENIDYVMDSERDRRTIVVGSRRIVGKSLSEIRPIHNFGVTISRIARHNIEFVPDMADEIAYGDSLLVVGEPENIDKFAEYAGHRARAADETDLISLGLGIICGIILGLITFDLGGEGFSLGMAGGPLFVALVLGHFGRVGPVLGYLPRASHLLLMESGLVFFLADAGVEAGVTLVPVLQQHGLNLSLASLAIAFVPMICGYLFGRFVLRMNLLEIVGGVCGGMTSTPGLGVITAKTDIDIPVVSYAAAYPVALILMTVFAQVLVTLLN